MAIPASAIARRIWAMPTTITLMMAPKDMEPPLVQKEAFLMVWPFELKKASMAIPASAITRRIWAMPTTITLMMVLKDVEPPLAQKTASIMAWPTNTLRGGNWRWWSQESGRTSKTGLATTAMRVKKKKDLGGLWRKGPTGVKPKWGNRWVAENHGPRARLDQFLILIIAVMRFWSPRSSVLLERLQVTHLPSDFPLLW